MNQHMEIRNTWNFFLIIMSKIYLYLLLISLFYKIIISKK